MIGLRINLASLTAQRFASLNRLALVDSLLRLSSAKRLNRAADGPAAVIASETLQANLAALDAETRIHQRAYHQATVAEGALGEVSGLLTEAAALAAANADSTLSAQEKAANQLQIDSIISSVDRISRTTSFAGKKLLDGAAQLSAGGVTVDIDNVASGELGEIEVDGDTYHLSDIQAGGELETTGGNVADAQAAIAQALDDVNTLRGKVGSFQKYTVEARLGSLSAAIENLSAADSLIADTDFTSETSHLIRAQILEQTLLTTQALADARPRNALSLLHSSRS